MNYVQPNLTNQELIALIRDKIEAKEPFAMARFGDGELSLLRRNLLPVQERRMCQNWGYIYPNQLNTAYDRLSATVFRSFDSDVIGLMHRDDINTMILNRFKKNWLVSESEAKRFCIHDKPICNHLVSRSVELGSMRGLRDLLQGKDLHVISIRTKALQHLSTSLNCKVTFTDHCDINLQNRSELIKSFGDIKADVVVFATGLMKDYGVILRDQFGKVAIDMGATVDAWAGVESRPWFKKGGPQDYLTKR